MICLMENTIPKPVPFTSIIPTMNTFRQKMNVQFSPPSHFALIQLHSSRVSDTACAVRIATAAAVRSLVSELHDRPRAKGCLKVVSSMVSGCAGRTHACKD